jgi:flagellar biosynthetic protein FliR
MLRSIVLSWYIQQGALATLVLGRVAGVAWTAPGWGTSALGWRLRVGLAALLTMLLVPLVGPGTGVPVDPVTLAKGCVGEVAVGATLGMTAALVLAGARQAGEMVGSQAGYSAAALFDPEAGNDLTPLGHLYGLIALAVFVGLDGPMRLVGALVESFVAVPAGGFALTEESVGSAFERIGWALGLALGAAWPAAMALLTASLALGLLARTAPTLQIASLAFPVRAALGVLVALASLVTLVAVFSAAWRGLWPVL